MRDTYLLNRVANYRLKPADICLEQMRNTSRRRSRVRRRTWRLRFHKARHHRQETLWVKAVCGRK
jgi:hypothetical protein